MDIKKKRKMIETFISNFCNSFDPSGTNTTFYKNYFKKMSDEQFKKFMNNFENLYIGIESFGENDTKMEDIEKTAKLIDIDLYEYVVFKDKETGKMLTTAFPVPVGYLHTKRVQQLVIKKNSTTTDVEVRNNKTGQVTGDSKTAKMTDIESYALNVLEAHKTMKEFYGPRAGDMKAKEEMYSRIVRDGYVALEDLPDEVENKTPLVTTDTYLLGMGLKSNLVTNSKYMLLKTALQKENKTYSYDK